MSATSVLARKWRPRNFSQLAGQEHVVRALGNALAHNRLHHAYLFTGTRGVGKTTIARIFAKSLNCLTGVTATPCGECSACREIDSGRFVDLIELDAASNTQVDNMRELLEGALYAPTSGRFKVYIIDEVHMLSKSAFNAMLKTLEEPPPHVKFILATTDPQKIPVTVLSRCLQFNLKQLPSALIASHLQHVLTEEGLPFEQGAVNLVARAAQGSMRDALSLMDQAIAFSAGSIEEAAVRSMLGAMDQGCLYDLLSALGARDGAALLQTADAMSSRSVSFESALQELASLLHRVALMQTVPQAIPDDEPERARLQELAGGFSAEDVQMLYQIAIHGRAEIDLAPDEYAGFTMTLLRMLAFVPAGGATRGGRNATGETQTQGVKAASAPVALPISAASAPVAVAGAADEAAPGRDVGALSAAPSAGQPDWAALVAQLNIQAMAQQLAKHCVLEELSEHAVVLRLAPEFKHLQTRMAAENLQAALAEHFGRPIRLGILQGAVAEATPAKIEHQSKQLRQQHASASIREDAFVNEAQAELGAVLLTESIRPN